MSRKLWMTQGIGSGRVTAPALGALLLLGLAAACQPEDTPSTAGTGTSAGTGAAATVGTGGAMVTAGTGGASTAGTGGASTTAGAGGSAATGTGGAGGMAGAGGAGGAKPCVSAGDCPGQDSGCKTRACKGGLCDFDLAAEGSPAASQKAKDCLSAVCDGQGAVKDIVDDADLPDDLQDCTVDTCSAGVPTFTPLPVGSACMQGGGIKCSAEAKCVACLDGADCASLVCDPLSSTCAAASCGDAVKNGGESDVDCGGPSCAPCAAGAACALDADCKGGLCTAQLCAPTCADGAKNGGESDVDCGGPSCAPCDLGAACGAAGDCKTGSCLAGACACAGDHLMISEVRSRGINGAADELIEIYNPTPVAVVLDATWKIESRSNNAASYGTRWKGSGKSIPPHGHYLIVHGGYAQLPDPDDAFSGATGITDATSLRLVSGAAVIDAVCYGYSAATKATLMGAGYSCEGTPADNLPHKDAAGAGDVDVSIQRRPGGALGNCIDTGDSAADFITTMPAQPQSTLSPTTP